MGRKLIKTKIRPKQGAHLTTLREAAGLSQAELAHLVNTTQGNIAFWELSDKPPRSEILPKMAEVLGVSIEDILGTNEVRPKVRRGGPKGKLQKLFEDISRLPRRQQEKIIEFVSAFVKQSKKV